MIRSWQPSPNGERIVFSSRGDIISVPAEHGITLNLTETAGVHERNASWSPDGKYIAYISDKTGEFEIYLQTQDGSENPVQLTQNSDTYIFGFEWSPDSKWITYTKAEKEMTKIRLYDVQAKKSYEVTEGWYSSTNPGFSSDRKYLVFTSARDFSPMYSRTEWNHAYVDMNRIYLVTLAKDTKSPFAPENDVVKEEGD